MVGLSIVILKRWPIGELPDIGDLFLLRL